MAVWGSEDTLREYLKQNVSDLEIRLFVGPNDHLRIKGYEIEMRPDSE